MNKFKGITRNELRDLVRDLNDVLDLKPPLIVSATKADLIEGIKKVAELLEKGDKEKLHEPSIATLTKLKIKVPWKEEQANKKAKEAVAPKKPNTDQFGFRIGSRKNVFAEHIKKSKNGLTMKEVKEQDWSGKQTQYNAWKVIMRSGKGRIDENKRMTIVG